MSNSNQESNDNVNQLASFYARYENELAALKDENHPNDLLLLLPECMQLLISMYDLMQADAITLNEPKFDVYQLAERIKAVVKDPITWYITKEQQTQLSNVYRNNPEILDNLHFKIVIIQDTNVSETGRLAYCQELNMNASKYITEPFYDIMTKVYQTINWKNFTHEYQNARYDSRLNFGVTIDEQNKTDLLNAKAIIKEHQNLMKLADLVNSKTGLYDLPSIVSDVSKKAEMIENLMASPKYHDAFKYNDAEQWDVQNIRPIYDTTLTWSPDKKDMSNMISDDRLMFVNDNNDEIDTSKSIDIKEPSKAEREATNKKSCKQFTPLLNNAIMHMQNDVDWLKLQKLINQNNQSKGGQSN